MKYRKFGKTGHDVSLLGFGTMRLPQTDDNPASVHEDLTIRMMRTAIDAGVNYVDCAYMYHEGVAETVTGKALKDGYREKVLLADKMPVWLAKSAEDVPKLFQEQLQRLDVDVIDMYLVHNITAPIWKRVQEYNVLPFLEDMRAEGKIRYIGFSFHDEFTLFQDVVDAYPWDFCQIQLNYMDADYQAGVKGLKYAASRDIPVIIMEPLKGGRLTDALPPTVDALWKTAPVQRTPAEWAFRWVANFPEVSLILSGMGSMAQVQENLRILADAEPNSLTEEELEIIGQVSDEYNRLIPYSCTGCKYCMPCPNKLAIPTLIQLRNEWALYEGSNKTKNDFHMWIAPKRMPSTCIGCKICEEKCPQHLPIVEIMKEAAEIFE